MCRQDAIISPRSAGFTTGWRAAVEAVIVLACTACFGLAWAIHAARTRRALA